jgi:molybdopterin-guanine dinucleotide biosynthesis protein A
MRPIRQMIDRGQLSIHKLFPLVKTRYLETEEIERFDPRHLSFFNINTFEELERAREIASELQP